MVISGVSSVVGFSFVPTFTDGCGLWFSPTT
ncbi:hypothetical protein CHY_2235 [Carboxydothermus hydrogenoformans Z-2901]|uniref:Uncharacterized protein n=1 Tax=Carboxydothermus hydrogenoformans (strain ATCC BAA-161 / DSM 6008 / Z-2901) TaxID=246194 RepID=Q3A9Y9_CARHZ|nr:hypothetical protein CHY_2235 [Carboxydothermus hydrogenoformans Z-2901]